jgi:hypothetical protein
MRRWLWISGVVIGGYLIVRAIVEFFVIDYGHPASYSDDWGGSSLVGVLAVHAGPGLIAAALMAWVLVRARRGRTRTRS